MTGIERMAIEVLGALFLVWGTVLYLEHRGAAACVAADASAITKQEAHNAAQAASDTKEINQEASTYHEALAAPADPTPALVCVRKYAAPRPVSETATAGPRADGPAQLPKANSGSFDPGPKLTPIGQEADARVAALQDYITRVCLAKGISP
jgi:hypothetical protein